MPRRVTKRAEAESKAMDSEFTAIVGHTDTWSIPFQPLEIIIYLINGVPRRVIAGTVEILRAP